MDNANVPELMKILTDKMGGDSSKINSIFNMMQASSATSNNTDNHSSTTSDVSSSNTLSDMPDIETIMKIKKVIDSMKANSNDPNVNLLTSLKPYLREEKQSKIDQYIKILNMSKAMSMFNDMGGDAK